MPTDRRSLLRAVAATGTTAILGGLAGCVGQDGDADENDDGGTEEPADDATVQVRTHDQYGDYLVDSEGMSLYMFTQDEDGESVCYDDCADNWPPLTVEGEPTAGDDVTAELATTERDDGSMQVTASGWPLYYFAADDEAGDASGQGANDVWFLLAPDGSKISGEDADSGY